MSDDKKIIFSMVGVSKSTPQGKQIIKNIYLSFYYGAKIGIIGLNGSGKSTVMKIIAGLDQAYQGDVVFSPGYTIGYLSQEPEIDGSKTVKEVVMEGAQDIVDILKEYEEINASFMDEDILNDPDKMDKLIARPWHALILCLIPTHLLHLFCLELHLDELSTYPFYQDHLRFPHP